METSLEGVRNPEDKQKEKEKKQNRKEGEKDLGGLENDNVDKRDRNTEKQKGKMREGVTGKVQK